MQINHNLPPVGGDRYGVHSNGSSSFMNELRALAPQMKNRPIDGSLPKGILIAAEKIYDAQTPVLTDYERELRFGDTRIT